MRPNLLIALTMLATACITSEGVWDEAEAGDTADDGAAGPVPGGKNSAGKDKPDAPSEQAEDALGQPIPLFRIMTLAKNAGLPCDKLVIAGALAMAESGGWSDAVHVNGSVPGCEAGSRDRGLWQINDCFWPGYDDACAFDPECNAGAMADISDDGASFELWSAYDNGTYASFLGDAEAAYAQVAACNGGAPDDPPEQDGEGAQGPSGEAECGQLGYTGTCLDDVAIWSDDDACWVRDCASEGKHCGLISGEEGYGCIEGATGSTKHDCASLGYEGECAGEVLIWADQGSCHYVDCGAQGQGCSWAGAIGYDCQ